MKSVIVIMQLACILVFLAATLCRAGAPSPKAASASLRGTVVDVIGSPVAGAEVLIEEFGTTIVQAVLTDENGEFVFPAVPAGTLTIRVSRDGFQSARKAVVHPERGEAPVTIVMQLQVNRSEVTISGAGSPLEGATEVTKGLARLDDVTGVQINAAKKNEVIVPEDLDANLAVPAPRQAFAKIPGVNPWENDGSGVQLAVATRGLNPNWSWEFNVRLNGYDISADVFGYPEAYATPPLEMVERVELVRGAGALQYGTQFGGLLNFRMKQPPAGRRLHFETQKAVGAFGLLNTYNGIGGMHGRWAYAGAAHHRRAEGWRHNSRFDVTTGYGLTRVRMTERLSLAFELTSMNYTMQRPLGLTLEMFNADPQQSLRARNWMGLRWLVPAVRLQFNKDARTRFELQAFGLSGDRSYVGNIAPVANAAGLVLDVAGRPRQTDVDQYRNGGFEARGLTSVVRHKSCNE